MILISYLKENVLKIVKLVKMKNALNVTLMVIMIDVKNVMRDFILI